MGSACGKSSKPRSEPFNERAAIAAPEKYYYRRDAVTTMSTISGYGTISYFFRGTQRSRLRTYNSCKMPNLYNFSHRMTRRKTVVFYVEIDFYPKTTHSYFRKCHSFSSQMVVISCARTNVTVDKNRHSCADEK